MIAALIDKELARKARGERYAEVLGVHLERQMQEIREHAEFCKKHSGAEHHPSIDKLMARYERTLALATNEGHRLAIYEMTAKPKNYFIRLRKNRERYAKLDHIAESMFPPPPKEARLTYTRGTK